MARGTEGKETATPRAPPKKTGSSQTPKSGPRQQSIAGFFQKRAPTSVTPAKRTSDFGVDKTPATQPSSSAAAPPSSQLTALPASQQSSKTGDKNKENGTFLHDSDDKTRLTS